MVKILKIHRGQTMINCRIKEPILENLSKKINFGKYVPQCLKLSIKQRND